MRTGWDIAFKESIRSGNYKCPWPVVETLHEVMPAQSHGFAQSLPVTESRVVSKPTS